MSGLRNAEELEDHRFGNWLLPPREWIVREATNRVTDIEALRLSYGWQGVAAAFGMQIPLGGFPGDWWWFELFGIPLGVIVPVSMGFFVLLDHWRDGLDPLADPVRWWFPLSVMAITALGTAGLALWGTAVTWLLGGPLSTVMSMFATVPYAYLFVLGFRSRLTLENGELLVLNHWYGVPTGHWDCGNNWSVVSERWSPDLAPQIQIKADVGDVDPGAPGAFSRNRAEVACFELRSGVELADTLRSAA